ncbi:MAG TPA: hypothetical protein VJR89_04495, partial [Polyangiales bacterium]|nr:hypothetical protein [Polyangiales bacterium]
VALKTGTASGLTDLSAVLATREFLVGAWAGRFDAAATRGKSGMWAAAPLAARALEIALAGRAPSLPARPTTLPIELDPVVLPDAPPPALAAWAERARTRGPGAK